MGISPLIPEGFNAALNVSSTRIQQQKRTHRVLGLPFLNMIKTVCLPLLIGSARAMPTDNMYKCDETTKKCEPDKAATTDHYECEQGCTAPISTRTPALAWSSWNYFEGNINEAVVLETADALVSTGLAKLGFTSVNMDADWAQYQHHRDSNGRLVPDPKKFPRGMKAVCADLHAKGLHCGLYGDISNRTCGGPSFMGHEELDMRTFAEWGVDCKLRA
jgi:hypothetical protein